MENNYQFPKCRIINNNFLSQFFKISKGVRQGDPLSLTVFILCIQCLANNFKPDVIFKGVMLTNETLKLTMFADDILLFYLVKKISLSLFLLFCTILLSSAIVNLIWPSAELSMWK